MQRALSASLPNLQKTTDTGGGVTSGKRPQAQPPPPTAAATPATGAAIANCNAMQTAAIRKGISDALTAWLPPVIRDLSVSPVAPATATLLKTHFKTTSPADIKTILANFQKIMGDVDGSTAQYECESWHVFCAVGSAFTHCSSRTSHICSDVFGMFAALMTRTVIHETGHRLGLCRDVYCDLHAADYKVMPAATAMANPDSYAAFAGELSGRYLC